MIRAPRLGLVERTANQVVRDYHIDSLPVCPKSIALAAGIEVEAKPMEEGGCSGMLLRLGDQFGILYATHLQNAGFEAFSIAHELGHYFLPDHPENVLSRGAHQSHAGFSSNDPYEREADFFAASLMMPASLFRPTAARQKEGMDAIVSLADICKTSLTATAIRYAKYTHAAVAVILSTGGRVDCCFQSDAMRTAKVGWLKVGSDLPNQSATQQLSQQPDLIRSGHREYDQISLPVWFDGAPERTATEEVIGLGRYGKILTVIHCNGLTARAEEIDDEEDEEAELIVSWTPRFRR